MKHEIIKTDNYLLIISNEEIKKGDWVFNKISKEIYQFIENYVSYEKKIIAHLPLNGASILKNVDLLPPVEHKCKYCGVMTSQPDEECYKAPLKDEVEKLAIQEVGIDNSIYNISDHESFIKGYNKAKEKYKYTKEDIINFVEWIAYTKKHGSVKPLQEAFIQYKISSTKELFEIYQYLQQPKMPVEFEREIEVGCIDNGKEINQYKVSYNSQGITQWVGKYIY